MNSLLERRTDTVSEGCLGNITLNECLCGCASGSGSLGALGGNRVFSVIFEGGEKGRRTVGAFLGLLLRRFLCNFRFQSMLSSTQTIFQIRSTNKV